MSSKKKLSQEDLETLANVVIEEGFWLETNMNDTFNWCTAETGKISIKTLLKILPIYKNHGPDTLTAFEALKQKVEPLKPLQTSEYRKAKKEIDKMSKENKYFFD